MSTQKNLITLCFATVFTLGLAACGGGGGGDAPVAGMMDGDVSLEGKYIPSGATIAVPGVPDAVITVVSGESETLAGLGTVECASEGGCSGTVENGVLTIMGDLKIVSVDPDLDSDTAMLLAVLAVDVDMLPVGPTEPDSACAASATSEGCVDEKNMAMDEAKKALDAAEADENSTQKQIADAQKAYDDAKKAHGEAMSARNTYLAMQPSTYDHTAVAKAIFINEDDVRQVSPMPLADLVGTGGEVAGGKVTVADGETKFAASTSEIADLGRSWMGAVYKRMTKDVPETQKNEYMSETVVVYTDDEGPDSAMFSAHYPVGGAPTDHSPWVSIVLSVVVDANGNNPELTLGGGSAGAAGNGGAVDDDSRAQIVGLSETLPDDTQNHTINGMFHGVLGNYECSGMDCQLLFDDAGGLTQLEGTWTFTPGKPATYVIGVIPDAAYLDFGYWVIETPGNDGPVYEVGTFAMGKGGDAAAVDPPDTGAAGAGKATYTGPATGLYVRKSIDSDTLEGTPVASGQFAADAKLTAYLGAMTAKYGTELNDTISGTVSKFLDMDGNMIASGWTVELMQTGISTDERFTGMTTGGGAWGGNFYEERTDEAPGSVAGTFDAHFVNGHVAGAFGANADE